MSDFLHRYEEKEESDLDISLISAILVLLFF
jgi:hypothetical protein